MLTVRECEDGCFIIEWSNEHPYAKIFNNWTQDDWIAAVKNGIDKVEANGKQTGQRLSEKVSSESSNAQGIAGKEITAEAKG